MSLDFRPQQNRFALLLSILFLILVVAVTLYFLVGRDALEGWPIGITSCPTPDCIDH